MDEKTLTQLLKQVKGGKVSVDDAVGKLKDLPFAELGYATLDTHRSLRFGFPEVVLGEPEDGGAAAGHRRRAGGAQADGAGDAAAAGQGRGAGGALPQGRVPPGGAHLPLEAGQGAGRGAWRW